MSQSQPPFIRLCSIEEVPEGTFKRFLIEAKEILLPKFEGQYHAMEERGHSPGRTPLCRPWKTELLHVVSILAGLAYQQDSRRRPNLTMPPRTHAVRVENDSIFASKRSLTLYLKASYKKAPNKPPRTGPTI